MRYLVERGLVGSRAGVFRRVDGKSLAEHIPEGLRDVIGQRLSRRAIEPTMCWPWRPFWDASLSWRRCCGWSSCPRVRLLLHWKKRPSCAGTGATDCPGQGQLSLPHASIASPVCGNERFRAASGGTGRQREVLEAVSQCQTARSTGPNFAEHFAYSARIPSRPWKSGRGVRQLSWRPGGHERCTRTVKRCRSSSEHSRLKMCIDPGDGSSSAANLLLALGEAVLPTTSPCALSRAGVAEHSLLAEDMHRIRRAPRKPPFRRWMPCSGANQAQPSTCVSGSSGRIGMPQWEQPGACTPTAISASTSSRAGSGERAVCICVGPWSIPGTGRRYSLRDSGRVCTGISQCAQRFPVLGAHRPGVPDASAPWRALR